MKHFKHLCMLFAAMLLSINVWGADATLTFSAQGYTNAQQVSSGTIDTYTSWSATDGSNPTAYYNTGSGLRVYSGGTFAISSSKTIASITLTFSGTGYTFSTSNTNQTQTVTPNATSYSWDVSRTCRLQKVEVTYAAGGDANPFTVTLMDNNTELTEASAGAGVTLPSRTTTCSDYTFMGWSETHCETETTTAPTIIEVGDYKPSKNIELWPVFKKSEGDATPQTASVTISDYASTHNWQNDTQYASFAIDNNISIAASGSNSGKYYTSGTNWRLYQNGTGKATVTAADGYSLTSVKFTFTVANTGKLSYGSNAVTSNTAVNVSGSSATFTVGNTGSATNGQVKITVIEVKYAAESQNYYIAVPTCDAEPELIAIGVTGTPAEFWKGDEFNYDGITVTALWDDETETDVTSKCVFSGYDMSVVGAQTVTVTYKGETTTYPIEIKTIANTEETAYSTTEAKSLIDAGKDLVTEVYVAGTISKIDSYNSTYKSITYWLDDNIFEIYGGLAGDVIADGFSKKEDLAVGEDVVVKGKLAKYGSTYEFTQNNVLISLKRIATLSIANISVANGGDITPVITTSIVGDYTMEYSSDNEEVVLAADDEMVTMGVGTATITATITAAGYKTKTTTFTVTVTSNATLESISIGGTATKTTYVVGDEMDYSGLTVTALYSDATTPDVTGVVEWSVSPATLAATTTNVTVTATYEGKTATKSYGVTVNKKVSSIAIADFSIENTRSQAISATTTPAGANLTYEVLTGADKVSLEGNVVTGTAEGTATIKAIYATTDTYQACEYTFTVTVTPFIPTTTWDLSIASYASAAEDKVAWEDDAVDMIATKEDATTKTNNYLGGSGAYTSTRFYKDSKLTFTPNGVTITSIVYEATTSGYATALANSTWTNATATADDKTVTITPTDGTQPVYATMSNTTGAASVSVKYSGTPAARLRSIALSGTYPTVFDQGDEFSHDGMVVTAEYTDNTSADVAASATFSGYNMATPGTQTVTVSYTFNGGTKTATYEITVNRHMTSQTKEGVDFASKYSSVTTSAEVEDVEGLSFDMFFAKPAGSSNPTKYYDNGKAVRAYTGNTITIVGADPILWVEVVWAGSSYIDDAMTLEYSADRKTATLTFSKTCRFTAINVYYQEDYKRTGLIFGKIGTICLAEGVAYAEGGAFYEIEKKNPIGIDLIEAEMPLTPGKPYIFQSEGSEIKVIYTNETPATEVVAANGLVGNLGATNLLLPMLAEGHETYIFKDNHICKASGDNANYVAPGRAYLDYTLVEDLSVASPAPGRRRISLNDAEAEVATSMNALVSGEKAQKIIINGEILILRNEKMYNAAGMLIK